MTITLFKILVSILPIVSIFLVGQYYPPSQQEYHPVFQPPGWVFGVVWTYVTLAFGIITARTIENGKYKGVWVFYVLLLLLLNGWLVINSKKEYKMGFYWLLCTACVAIAYIGYLGGLGEKRSVWLLPLPFWLVIATSLNGVIYDASIRR